MLNARCLMVGLQQASVQEAASDTDSASAIPYQELPGHLPPESGLQLVIAPLFCPEFDALELIATLGKAGYRGALRIIAPKLPSRQIVLRELRAHAARQGVTLERVEATA